MPAVTQPNVKVDSDGWTQLSAAAIQKLQLLIGSAGVIYADSQPANTIRVGGLGHILDEHQFINTDTGGTAWGRATDQSGVAHFGITEG